MAMAAVLDLPLSSRLWSSTNLLVMVRSSKSSPMAPPVLKSSSMAAMKFSRQRVAAVRARSTRPLKRARRWWCGRLVILGRRNLCRWRGCSV